MKGTTRPCNAGVDFLLRCLFHEAHALGPFVKNMAGAGQGNMTGTALYQGCAIGRFQGFELMAQGRLGNTQFPRCGRNRAGIDDFDKITIRFQIHGNLLCIF